MTILEGIVLSLLDFGLILMSLRGFVAACCLLLGCAGLLAGLYGADVPVLVLSGLLVALGVLGLASAWSRR